MGLKLIKTVDNMTKKQKLISLAVAVLLVLFVMWFIFDGVPVEIYKVTRQDALKGVTVTGIVRSREDVFVTSSKIGNIEKFYVKEGDFVKKGQLIATLERKTEYGDIISAQGRLETAYWELENLLTEPRKQEVEIARAEVNRASQKIATLQARRKRILADLAYANIEEERYTALEAAGAATLSELQQRILTRREFESTLGEISGETNQARAELRQAQERLSLTIKKVKEQEIKAAQGRLKSAQGGNLSAEGNFEDFVIRAPVSGIITDRILHTGSIASPTSPIVRLVVPELIFLSMEVEENERQFIKEGQKAFAVFDAYPGKIFECRVKDIVKQVNPLTGTFETKLSRPEEKINLNVGMTVDASIIVGESKNALIIPTDFITQKDGKPYVFVKRAFWARKTYVAIENFDNNRTKIISGLKNGDIVLKSIERNKLKNNTHIKVRGYYKL